ncbi:MAG: DUF5126 domain-containing protein [Phocaeicola sp.]
MKKNISKFILSAAICGALFSCAEEHTLPQKLTSDAPRTFTDSEISWRPISGGAIIKYQTPPMANIRGIEARYKLGTGEKVVMRGSFLSDSIMVEGFLTEDPQNIELYVIDTSDNYSAPYNLKVIPNRSPLVGVQESLQVKADFGGMQIEFKNVDRRPIATFISRVEEKDTILIEQYYTDSANPLITIRGEEAKEYEYIFQFRDRWNNYTDKLCYKLTPHFEKYVNEFTYMPSEYFHNASSTGNMYKWFDGVTSASGWGDVYWPEQASAPHWSAIRLTNPTAISRVVLWQYAWGATNYSHFYFGANARKVELYGSTIPNPQTGDPATAEGWEFIMLCEIKMPSGKWYNSDNQLTEEDFDVAKNRGHEFILPLKDPMPEYRAISFKVVEAYEGPNTGGLLSEIQIFGDDRPKESK